MTEIDAAILAMERRYYRHAGEKEQVIRDEMGMSPTRYYQLLTALLDDREALATEPVVVNRLRRIRESRRLTRQRMRAG